MASLQELPKLFKVNPANAGNSRKQLIEAFIKDVLETGIPIGLSVVVPGSLPVIKLVEETLTKLILMMV
jgi:hypothetical protein